MTFLQAEAATADPIEPIVGDDDLSRYVSVVAEEYFPEYGVSGDKIAKVHFLRVRISNTKPAIRAVVGAVSDTSWLEKISSEPIKESFLSAAEPTISKISEDLTNSRGTKLLKDIGEYIVSIVAHYSVEMIHGHSGLPLAELIKEKLSGNPGFDFHHETSGVILVFGEAKYVTGSNAYPRAFNQIVKFIAEKKDIKELHVLRDFASQESQENVHKGIKGYTAAFSTSGAAADTESMIRSIKANSNFKTLVEYEKLLVVAVDIDG